MGGVETCHNVAASSKRYTGDSHDTQTTDTATPIYATPNHLAYLCLWVKVIAGAFLKMG